MAIEEFKDIKRIDAVDAEARLIKRQLGFVKGADTKGGAQNSSYKMKYKTQNEQQDEVIEFTPDHGNPDFNSVTLTTVASDMHAATKKYVDDAVGKQHISNFRPSLNGFVHPEYISLTFVEGNTSLHIAPKINILAKDESGNSLQSLDYYVNGHKYQIATGEYPIEEGTTKLGHHYVLLDKNSRVFAVKEMLDEYKGLTSLCYFYREELYETANEIITVTPSYHGISLSNKGRDFIHKHNGPWIESGFKVEQSAFPHIVRTSGVLVNEDVPYRISGFTGGEIGVVLPAVWQITSNEGDREEFEDFIKAGDNNWLSTLCPNPDTGTAYQVHGGLNHIKNQGGWFLYFIRKDLRNIDRNNDVLVPLDISKLYDKRYEGLDESIRRIVSRYKPIVIDWKALGLIFIDPFGKYDYLNIANFELNDLLYGDLIERFATQNSISRFTDLTDTPSYSSPSGYSEHKNRALKVKNEGDGLEFTNFIYVSTQEEFKEVAENATEKLNIWVTKEFSINSPITIKENINIYGETVTLAKDCGFEIEHYNKYAFLKFFNDVHINTNVISSFRVVFCFCNVFLTTNTFIALRHGDGADIPAQYENCISSFFRLEGNVIKRNWQKNDRGTTNFDNHNLSINSANPTRFSPMVIHGTPVKVGKSMTEYMAVETGVTSTETDTTLYLDGFVRDGSPGNVTNLIISKYGSSPTNAIVYVKELINSYVSYMTIKVEEGVTLYWERKSDKVLFHPESQGTIEQKWWSRNEIGTSSECEKAGLIEVVEDGKTGYCLKNDVRELKQSIGQDAIDLSSVVND